MLLYLPLSICPVAFNVMRMRWTMRFHAMPCHQVAHSNRTRRDVSFGKCGAVLWLLYNVIFVCHILNKVLRSSSDRTKGKLNESKLYTQRAQKSMALGRLFMLSSISSYFSFWMNMFFFLCSFILVEQFSSSFPFSLCRQRCNWREMYLQFFWRLYFVSVVCIR